MIDNNGNAKNITILMAEDDMDDQFLTKEALADTKFNNALCFVSDGVELMDYLHQRGLYSEKEKFPLPDLILLDLNLPRMDGREALKEIKADSNLRRIPVVILTTSKEEEDIFSSYNLGASGFISKPVTYTELVKVMKTLNEYWVSVVELPNKERFS